MNDKHDADCTTLAAVLDAHSWEVYAVTAGDIHDGIRVYGPFVTWEEAAAAAGELDGQAFTMMGRDITREF
jgi:hypothetical protein